MAEEESENISKLLQTDNDLQYTNSDFMELVSTVNSSSTPPEELLKSVKKHPTPHVFAKIAELAYEEWNPELFADTLKSVAGEWEVITVAYHYKFLNNYYGIALWNRSSRQIVIAHRGTNSIGAFITDAFGVYLNKYTSQINSAITFVNKIKEFVAALNEKSKINFQVFITGHSLGGWLAQVTAYSFRYLVERDKHFIKEKNPPYCYFARTVTFDSPGCRMMLDKMELDFDSRTMFATSSARSLDITSYLTVPNIVNTINYHAGVLLGIEMETSWVPFSSHKMTSILEYFDEKTGQFREGKLKVISDWAKVGLIVGDEKNRLSSKDYNSQTLRTNAFMKSEQKFLKLYNYFYNADHETDIFVQYFEPNAPKTIHELLKTIKIDKSNDEIILETGVYDTELVIPYVRALLQIYNIDYTKPNYQTLLEQQRTEDFTSKCERAGIMFERDLLNIEIFLKDVNKKVLIIKVEINNLTIYKIIDILKKARYSLSNLDSLNANLKPPILCLSDEPDISEECKAKTIKFFNELKNQINGKLIFVVEKESEYLKTLKEMMSTGGLSDIQIKTVEDKSDVWNNLTKNSKNDLITKKIIKYGKEVISLSEFFSSEKLEVINKMLENCPQIVEKLMKDQTILLSGPRFLTIDSAIVDVHKKIQNFKLDKYLSNLNPYIVVTMDSNERGASDRISKNPKIPADQLFMPTNFTDQEFKEFCSDLKDNLKIAIWIHISNDQYVLKRVYDPTLYCKRELKFPDKIVLKKFSEKYLVEQGEDCLVFSDKTSKDQFEKEIKIGANLERLFMDMSVNSEGVIWTKKCNNKLFLHKTHGVIENLTAICEPELEILQEDEFLEKLNDKSAIIIDEPGMGKSTLLERIAARKCSSRWVILILLGKNQMYLDALPDETEEITVEKAANFLFNAGGFTKSDHDITIVQELLKCKLETKTEEWPLMLLFDGFDEVQSAKYRRKLMSLFKALRDKATICVSSRVHYKSQLENCLSVFATEFKPLNSEEQQQYLLKHWKYQLVIDTIPETAENFASKLIEKVNKLFSSTENKNRFIGVPLQLRLLGDGFRDDFLRYTKSPETSLSFEEWKVTRIYQTFINAKYRIFMEDKHNLQFRSDGPSLVADGLIKIFTKIHRHSAMIQMIKSQNTAKSSLLDLDIRKYQDDLCFLGLIRSFNDDIPEFAHKTFFEYFVADCIILFVKKEYRHPALKEVMETLLTNILTAPDNGMIRNFINEILEETELTNSITDAFKNVGEITYDKFCNSDGDTCFHVCVKENRIAIIEYLLAQLKKYPKMLETFLSIKNNNGDTALNVAVENNSEASDIFLSCLDELIVGSMPLYSTAFRYDTDDNDPIIVSLLKKCEKFVNLKDISTQIQEDWALIEPFLLDAKNGSLEDMKNKLNDVCEETKVHLLFVRRHRTWNIENVYEQCKWSAMHIASERGRLNVIEFLLETAGLEYKNECVHSLSWPDQKTPLHLAAEGGHLNVVKCLIDHGAEINVHDINNEGRKNLTPLHIAAEKGHLEIVKFLVEKGADVNARTRSGGSTINLAIKTNEMDILKYLVEKTDCDLSLKNHAGISVFTAAVRDGNDDIVRYLLSKCRNIREPDRHGMNVLYHALRKNKWRILEILVKSGVDINAPMGRNKSALDLLKTRRKQDYVDKIIKISNIRKNSSND